ncbi:MAG: T9SS type A sorting domain-containing protein [Rhizobacter sp.]|nr:T9SS type A sorting domain-containing protein [Chlorobiales bacterium]
MQHRPAAAQTQFGDTLYTFTVPSLRGIVKVGERFVLAKGSEFVVTDLRGNIEATYSAGGTFRDLAFTGRYILASDGYEIRKIDTATFAEVLPRLVSPYLSDTNYFHTGIGYKGDRIWAAAAVLFSNTPRLTAFDTSANAVHDYGTIPYSSPLSGVALALDSYQSPPPSRLWLANSNVISCLDTATGQTLREYDLRYEMGNRFGNLWRITGFDIVYDHPDYPNKAVALLAIDGSTDGVAVIDLNIYPVDVAPKRFVFPASGQTVSENASFRPAAKFLNAGLLPVSGVSVRYEFINTALATVFTSTKSIAFLAAYDSVQVVFDSLSGGLPSGTYTAKLTVVTADSLAINDTLTATVNVSPLTSGPAYVRFGLLNTNNVKTRFVNTGLVGGASTPPACSWPTENNPYLYDTGFIVGMEHTFGVQTVQHIITHLGPRGSSYATVNGQFVGFQPRPDLINPTQDSAAMRHNPATWPEQWNGVWPGWNSSNAVAADEALFSYDDATDSRLKNLVGYYPYPNDSLNMGAGLVVTAHMLQFTDSLASDAIYFVYDIKNASRTSYTKMTVGNVLGTVVANTFQNITTYDSSRSLVYAYNPPNVQPSQPWDTAYQPGSVGLRLLETPDSRGLTAFRLRSESSFPLNNSSFIWSLMSPGFDPQNPMPSATDALMSSGYFSLAAGETKRYAYAMFFADSAYKMPAASDKVAAFYASKLLDAEKPASPKLPNAFQLYQNYPNPFNPSTTIQFSLPAAAQVSLKIYDVLGRTVTTLVNERRPAGVHTATFNANRLSSGVYFYRLQAGTSMQTRKMLLLK